MVDRTVLYKNAVRKVIDLTIILLVFILSINRLFFFGEIRGISCDGFPSPSSSCVTYFAWSEVGFFAVAIVLMVISLWINGSFRFQAFPLRMNWILLITVLFAWLSMIWTVNQQLTLYRLLIFTGSLLAGMYFVIRYNRVQLNRGLGYALGITCLVFWIFTVLYPNGGIMQNPPYSGSFRGLFWHRNYTGSFAALSAAILIPLLIQSRTWFVRILTVFLLISSLVICIGSRSAAGVILVVLLTGLGILYLIWLQFRTKLSKTHYLIALFLTVILSILILSNLDTVFGLLNRSTSLTGRIPMWNVLFHNFWQGHEWMGYGYGTFWNYSGVTLNLQELVHWGYPVLIGDNGLVDLLMNLGIIGAGLFLALIFINLCNSLKNAIKNPDIQQIIPLVVIVFIIVANITLSWMLELETFTWILLCVYSLQIVKSFPK